MGRCYFSGSNSGDGFFNYFDGIVPPWAHLKRYFMIKGGPGVGKSTLMKRVAEKAEQAGEEVERFYCSGDPDSLDAVRLVEREIVFADATAPHCMDPRFPGAVEEIVNLGEQIDRARIVKYRDAVEMLFNKNKESYRKAYAFLGAAKALETERYKEIASCADNEKIAKCAKEIAELAGKKEERQIRRLFLDAISCKGCLSFVSRVTDGNKVYRITGEYKDVVADLLSAAVEADRKEVFCSPLRPQCVNHMLLRDSAILLTSEEGTDGTELLSENFLKKECDKTTEVFFNEARHMEEEAMKCLRECKKIHDELEEIYKASVNFERINERTEQLCLLVFSL
ncbi:MAG: hypothetical protein PUC30_02540 [Lachnospiraceae bacterium]|nr:hypothetical protein [Lachnospiraceae bacterium]